MIGSHNSMSYLPVRQWYLKPFGWMARCQSKTLGEQLITYGVRLFDFRVRFDVCGNLVFAHGPVQFKGDVEQYLSSLALECFRQNISTVYVRIILESNKPMWNQEWQEEHFKYFCEDILKKYPNLTFFGGNRKYDWKVIYSFPDDPKLIDLYSSTTNIFGLSKDHWTAKIDDLWPWLYARLYNKRNIKRYIDISDILFIDYINIR